VGGAGRKLQDNVGVVGMTLVILLGNRERPLVVLCFAGCVGLMTLSKCANSLGIQVHSVVVRESSPQGDSGLILNSQGTVKKALFVLIKQPAKHVPCLVSPTPPSGCQAQGFKISTAKKITESKLTLK
jgi:hypothetical protein